VSGFRQREDLGKPLREYLSISFGAETGRRGLTEAEERANGSAENVESLEDGR
jgi:hypothetical protein